MKKKIGDDEDINGLIGQMLSKYICCVPRTTTDHAESVQNSPGLHSIELGDVPANPVTGQQPERQCLHPMDSAQPSPTQCHNASQQIRQCYQPYREELPPPSYESVVNQNLVLPRAPPSETLGSLKVSEQPLDFETRLDEKPPRPSLIVKSESRFND